LTFFKPAITLFNYEGLLKSLQTVTPVKTGVQTLSL
jgi:hypothetical protein